MGLLAQSSGFKALGVKGCIGFRVFGCKVDKEVELQAADRSAAPTKVLRRPPPCRPEALSPRSFKFSSSGFT